MKVLVTGCAGFLGSHVCEWYRNKGHQVIGIDNFTTYELDKYSYSAQRAREHMKDFLLDIGVELIETDIRNKLDRYMFLEPSKPFYDVNYIIHTAAQPTMTLSITNPRLDMETNVKGTFNILELARKLDIPMVNCSTIHIYGNRLNKNLIEKETRYELPRLFDSYGLRQESEINEEQPILRGNITPLHASKRSAEIYTQCYIDTYGLKAANFRLTGMYGERQFAGIHHGWVSNFAIRTIMKRPITIYGTDKQVRDILYAKDAVEAFDCFYNKQKSGTYNIGGGYENSISLKECLIKLATLTGIEQNIKLESYRFGDLHYFVCDYNKALEKLGWCPTVNNDKGLKILVDWIQNNKQLFEEKQ